ncbi:His-Xaa-Ser system radical SAM maturase HxsB [Woeseiaceae bacterium]|nr:His-Xaa-Ser system radical SAM maturase HxsB [Woeseiaceae bacterium]
MSKFQEASAYQVPDTTSYSLIPFNFINIGNDRYRIVSMVGDFAELDRNGLNALVDRTLTSDSELYRNLRSRGFLFDSHTKYNVDLSAIKLRTKMAHVLHLTSLHIFVMSLRCEHSCPYCQVSRQNIDANNLFDMTEDFADKALAVTFSSPSQHVKIEFQGGEPLLNFDLLAHTVRRASELGEAHKKTVEFVIATNLAVIDEEMLRFCRAYSIKISTSLDGPRNLHNANRPRPGKDSYERTIEGIKLSRQYLGHDAVSALMTTSPLSIGSFKEIVDEYIAQEFGGIFLRPISPYGFAVKTKWAQKYSMDEWLDAYREALTYIVEINLKGFHFVEFYTALIARRILKPHYTGYVDLQHPSGVGFSALIYNYNGKVFSSDEGRMLAEMGDESFCIGHLNNDSYADLITSDALVAQIGDSFGYTASRCDQCAYLPYCGSDPTYHYATQNDYMGNKNYSGFCDRQMGVIEHVFEMLKDDATREIIEGWIS